MNNFRFLLLVLLGLCGSSMAAIARQMGGVHTGTIENGDAFPGKELTGRQGFPSSLLIKWDLKCALDREKTPWAPGKGGPVQGTFLSTPYCKTWFECNSDGTKRQIKDIITGLVQSHGDGYLLTISKKDWCQNYCECVVVDEPQDHPAFQFGCTNPEGKLIAGNFGSVSRDTASAQPPSVDELVMEVFEGPPRKE